MYEANEIKYCLKKVGIKALIADDKLKNQNFYKILNDIIPELPNSTPGLLKSAIVPNLRTIITLSNDHLP